MLDNAMSPNQPQPGGRSRNTARPIPNRAQARDRPRFLMVGLRWKPRPRTRAKSLLTLDTWSGSSAEAVSYPPPWLCPRPVKVPNFSSILKTVPCKPTTYFHTSCLTMSLFSRPPRRARGIIIAATRPRSTAAIAPRASAHPLNTTLLAFARQRPRADHTPLATRIALPSAAQVRPCRYGSGSAGVLGMLRSCCLSIAAVPRLVQSGLYRGGDSRGS